MVKRIFVANWKMQLSFNQSCTFMQEHSHELKTLIQQDIFVICPSFPALHSLVTMCEGLPIAIGAQTVSRHPFGAYTGEVSALSLAEAGCSYCIIGHSESRQYAHESNINIEHKLKELIKHTIIPIICIGETKEQHEQNNTYAMLKEQLLGCLQLIATHSTEALNHYIIAYEPVWAVGSDITPPIPLLTKIFAWLHKECSTKTNIPFSLIYGGSVNATNAATFLAIKDVDGLLIGRASTDIESLKKIMEYARI